MLLVGSGAIAGITIGDLIAAGLMIFCFVKMIQEIYYFYQNWGKSTPPSIPSHERIHLRHSSVNAS